MPLSSKDYKALLEIIEICYSIPDRNLMFKTLCERLQKLVQKQARVQLRVKMILHLSTQEN